MATPSVHANSRLDQFLFAPADARAVAAMRILLAAMIAWSFWSLGMRPAWPVTSIPGAAQWYGSVLLTRWYALIVTLTAMAFGVGFRPRITGLVLIVLLLPLASLNRGQQSRLVLMLALLAFAMLRSDACWSLRTWLGRATPAVSAGPMWPIRLIQIELSLVYAVNALAKSTPQYLSGEVLIGMSRMRPNFLMNFSDALVHLGPLAFPIALAAIGSVVVESYLAIGFWFPRVRWLTAMIGVAFHLGLQQVVRIFMLDYASMFLYLAFLLPWQGRTREEEATSTAL